MVIPVPNWSKIDRVLLFILIVAAAIRVVYLISYQSLPDWEMLTVDNYYHHNWATWIASGNFAGETTFFRAPFYVYCLAICYALFGTSLWIGRLFGVAIGLVSIVMTYLIGRRLVNRRVGLLAAALQSIYPMMIYFEAELLLDPLFMLLIQIGIHRILVWFSSNRRTDGLAAGLCFGLATITRPTGLIVVLVVLLFIIAHFLKKADSFRSTITFLAPIVAIVGIIFVRNLIVAADPVLIASQGGINLYIGNNAAADGLSAIMPEPLGHNWRIKQISHIAKADRRQELKPGEVSSYWIGRATAWIGDNPGKFALLYLKKLYFSIASREVSNNRSLEDFSSRINVLNYNPLKFGLLFILASVGLLVLLKSGNGRMILWIIVSYLLVTALFFFNSRFRLPLIPYFAILAAAGATTVGGRLQTGRNNVGGLIALMIGAAALTFYPLVPLPAGQEIQHHIARGIHLYHQLEYRQALEEFREAAEKDDSFPEVNLNLGATFLRLGNGDSAAYYLRKEAAEHPGRLRGHTNLASLFLVNHQFDSAFQSSKKAIEIGPYDFTAHTIVLRSSAADPDVGVDSIMAIIETGADQTDEKVRFLNQAATLLIERSEYEAAHQVLLNSESSSFPPIETDDSAFERYFRHDQSGRRRLRASTQYQFGYLAGLTGYFDEAIDRSLQAISLDPNLVEAYLNLASGYTSTGQPGRADSLLAELSVRFPENLQLQRYLSNGTK